jgi:hypothetical protein
MLLVSEYSPHKLQKKKKLCVQFKMASIIQNCGKFSMGCNFFLLNIFQSHFGIVCVKNAKKKWKEFLHFVTRWRHSPEGFVRNGFFAITFKE